MISDRFVDSSLAYQGCGREIGMKAVYDINMFAIEGFMPDKTIFLNVTAETGLERIRKGRDVLDRLDMESSRFHERVFEGYQEVIRRYKDRMIILDAGKPAEEVIEDAYHVMKELLDA